MFKHLMTAAVAMTLLAGPAIPAFAQAAAEKSGKADTKTAQKAKKELTPQQQKMKDCAPKWAAYKKEKNV